MADEKRLIEVCAEIRKIDECLAKRKEQADSLTYRIFEAVKTALEKAPTVDAVEVVHGRWIVRAEFNNGERVIAACSNCNVQGEVRTTRNEWGIWHIDSPYCPNCGAKMDGGAA